MSLALLLPGPIDQLTGGYLFAHHVVEGLARRGQPIDVIALSGRFPDADQAAGAAAAQALAARPDGSVAIIDGLGLAGFAACLAQEAKRLRLVAWVHHALADETGLGDEERARFHALERELLPRFRGILCPSRHTAAAVAAYGVEPQRIGIAPPGTRKPARQLPRRVTTDPLRLLLVATVTPRKGHLTLIDALAGLDRADWQLRCIGSLTRDCAYVAAVNEAIARARLQAKIALDEEIPQDQLSAAYEAADLFVLPSFLEGYGMAFAEALAHGLPIIGTRAGAIPDVVPESAGILVAPGNAAELGATLKRVIEDRDLLQRLTDGAAIAGAALPDWGEAVAHWHATVTRLLQ